MPRFYFHVLDDLETEDLDGEEFADIKAARDHARRAARALMCETLAPEGRITLDHRIDIHDEDHRFLETMLFGEAVRIETDR